MADEEWLRRRFEPALRTSRPSYEELRSELGALSTSGVLSEDRALHAFGWMRISVTVAGSVGYGGSGPYGRVVVGVVIRTVSKAR
jgi:hypothetical protein